jgi:uncharacterized protein YkvS
LWPEKPGFPRRGAEQLREFRDVSADDEHALAAGDQQAAHVLLRLDRVQCLGQALDGGAVELVDGLALEVELQLENPAFVALSVMASLW